MDFNFSINITSEFLDEVQEFIEDPEFIEFCLDNSTDLSVPGFIMTVVFEKLNYYREQLAKGEKE